MAATVGEGGNDEVTGLDVLDIGTHFFHDADGFMANRTVGLSLRDAAEPPQIRAANTGPNNFDDRIGWLFNRWFDPFFCFNFAGFDKYCYFHCNSSIFVFFFSVNDDFILNDKPWSALQRKRQFKKSYRWQRFSKPADLLPESPDPQYQYSHLPQKQDQPQFAERHRRYFAVSRTRH